jgi:hypothetical protein
MRPSASIRRSLSRVRIRPFKEADRPAVVDLWRRVGLYRPWNDPDRDIDRKLADSQWGMSKNWGRCPDSPAEQGHMLLH